MLPDYFGAWLLSEFCFAQSVKVKVVGTLNGEQEDAKTCSLSSCPSDREEKGKALVNHVVGSILLI